MKRKMRVKVFKNGVSVLLILVLLLCGVSDYGIATAEAVEKAPIVQLPDGVSSEDGAADAEEDEDCEDSEEEEEVVLDDCESLEVTYNVTDKWDGHYNMNITLLNISGYVVEDWELCFDFEDKIENIWNAKITDCDEKNKQVTIRNADWNQDIAVDEKVTFGMTVRYEDEIHLPGECYLTKEEFSVDKERYSVQYRENSKWDGHVNGQIVITNTGDKRIEDWKLELETDEKLKEFENIWNAKITDVYENTYSLNNAGYNQNIEPGQSVEFGFIAGLKGNFAIKDAVLYEMSDVEYDDGEYVEDDDYIDDPEDWEPEYDSDDFETNEEYAEYLESIGYDPENTEGISTISEKELYKPKSVMSTAISLRQPTDNVHIKAIQNFAWNKDHTTLLTQFHRGGEATYSSHICQSEVEYGMAKSDQGKNVELEHCAHGQSLERFTVKGTDRYMVCAGAQYGENTIKKIDDSIHWGQNVAFLEPSDIKKENKNFDYKGRFKKLKRIVGIKNYLKKKLDVQKLVVQRVDAALTANAKQLIIWCKLKKKRKRKILVLDMERICNSLYGKNKVYYSLDSENGKKAVLVCASDDKDYLQPNGSFQSIEISNSFKKDGKTKWNAYITSGNTYKDAKGSKDKKKQELLIERFTLTRGSDKLTNKKKVGVDIPHNSAGQPILLDSRYHEIEGCHIRGKVLEFILTDSQTELKKVSDKAEQFIVQMKKSEFKDARAKV